MAQQEKPSIQEESSRDDDSSTMTKTQVAAWCLSQQLIWVLQRQELSHRMLEEEEEVVDRRDGRDTEKRKRMQQMIQWLNTRLQFGCTALEYVQQAATLDHENDDIIGGEIQEELQAMLDFSEFDFLPPSLENSEDFDLEFEDSIEENIGTIDNSEDCTQEAEQQQAQAQEQEQEQQNSLELLPEAQVEHVHSPPIYNFGKPLEVVESDVPPLQNSLKVTKNDSDLEDTVAVDETENQEDEGDHLLLATSVFDMDDQPTKTTTTDSDTIAVDELENREEEVLENKEDEGEGLLMATTLTNMDDQPIESSSIDSFEQTPKTQSNSLDGMKVEPLTHTIPIDDEFDSLESGVEQQMVDVFEAKEGKDNKQSDMMAESGEIDPIALGGSVVDEVSNASLEEAKLYKASAIIAHSFETSTFNPPIWTRNGNLQTIGSFLARGKVPALVEFEWDERKRMDTPDGDFFVVDWKYSDLDENVGRPSDEVPLVLLCHGLQSNSDSYLAKDMARAFNSVGMDVACINFRGCSDEINLGKFGYHLGFTDDLKFMLEHIVESRAKSKVYLSGFSLGANVVTKLLADLKTDAFTKYNIRGAAVNALPFDFIKVGPNFSDAGLTKSLYGDDLLRSLRARVLENYDDQEYSFSKEELMNCKTLKEFDDLVVCDVYDFDDVYDYHRKCSTVSELDQVAIPQLVVQALDDPFFQGNTNPTNNAGQPLRIQYTDHGGHCGYWQNDTSDSDATWMPLQLAKFLKHVDDQQSSLHALYDVELEDCDLSADAGDIEKQDLVEERRQRAALVSRSFQVRDYHPASYATNAHVQTVMGALYRKETMYASSDLPSFISGISKFKDVLGGDNAFQWDKFQWDNRQRMETPDDDFFDVDWKTSGVNFESDDTPLVIICHGLQASSDSPLVKDMAEAFLEHGMGAACINFRGCGGEVNRTPRGYHLGFTEDLQQLVTHVNAIFPKKRIYLSAFSLGANVVTNFLANLGSDAYKYNIAGAAVNALPYEVSKSTMNLNSDGLTKTLYADRILESMYERIEEMYDSGVEFPFERETIRECKTIMDMENLVVAPFFGFKDAWDYYDKTSTLPRLDQVAVPELVIQSEDDPFLLGQSHMTDKADRPFRIHYTKHGGHCGHVFHATDQAYPTSWMPTELARFLAHVDLSVKVDETALVGQRNQKVEREILN